MHNKRVLMWSGIGIGSAIVLLVAIALVAPGFIDWNQYRDRITELAANATGREVTIAGNVSFQILPQPALSVADVAIANVENGRAPHFAQLESLDIEIALFPLLTGDIAVRRIVMDRPDIALEYYADGSNNWTFGTGPDAPESDNGGTARDVRLDRFAIHNGRLEFNDLAVERTITVTGVDAQISADSLSGPFKLKSALTYNGVPLSLTVNTGALHIDKRARLSATVQLTDASTTVSYSGSTTRLTTGTAFTGRLQFNSEDAAVLQAAVDKLLGHDLSAQYAGPGQPVMLDLDLEASPQRLEAESRSVRLGDAGGRLSASVELGEETRFDVSASLTTLDLNQWMPADANRSDRATSPEPDAPFELPANVSGSVALTVEAVSFNQGLIRQVAVSAGLADAELSVEEARALLPGGASVGLVGRLDSDDGRPRWTGSLDASAANLRALLTWLEVDLSSLSESQLAGFSIQSEMLATPERIALQDMTAQLDLSRITGDLSVRLDTGEIAANLTADRFNMASYLAAPDDDDLLDWPEFREFVEGSLAGLADMRAEIALDIALLGLNGTSAKDARLAASLAKGELTISRLSVADLAGGRVEVTGELTGLAEAPQFVGSVVLDYANPGEFLRWSGLELPIAHDRLGRIALSGKLAGGFDSISLELDGQTLGGRFDLDGAFTGLMPLPDQVNLTMALKHASQSDLYNRLGIAMMQEGRDAPLDLGVRISGRLESLDVTASGAVLGGELRIDGQAAIADDVGLAAYSLSIDARHPEVVDLLRVFDPGFRAAQDRLGPATLVSNVDLDDGVTRISGMRLLFGPASIQGTAEIRTRDQRPMVVAELSAGDLPINDFLPAGETGVAQAQSRPDQRWSKQPIETELFRIFDAEAQLKADSITFGSYRISNADLTLQLKDGLLEIDGLTGRAFGGQAQLAGHFDARDVPKLELSIGIDGGQIGEALQAAIGFRPVTGLLGMSGTFSASGVSQYELMRSMDGNARINAIDGTINGIDLPRLSRQMGRISSPQEFVALLGTALGGGGTPYSVLATELTCEDGILHITDFASKLARASLSVDGRIDIADWNIAGSGQFILTEHANAPPIGFDLTGNLSQPKASFQTQQLRRHMFDRLAGNVLQKLIGDEQSEGLSDLTGTKEAPPATADQESAVPEPDGEKDEAKKIIEGLFDVVRGLKKRPSDQQADEADKEPDSDPPPK